MANEISIIDANDDNELSVFSSDAITPEHFIKHYEEYIRRYVSKGRPSMDTMNTYRYAINQFLRICEKANRSPLSFNESNILAYRDILYNRPYNKETGAHYSAESISIKMIALRLFFRTAQKLGFIKNNPCENIEIGNVEHPDDLEWYSIEEIGKICKAFDDEKSPFLKYRNITIVYLMGVEGLRNIEVQRMNCQDINWDGGLIRIKGKGHLRTIYPSKDTFKYMTIYQQLCPDDKSIKSDGYDTPFILSDSNRNEYGRITRNGLRYVLNKVLNKINLKKKNQTCHILRHSCGTNLYAATKDLRIVQEVLGHQDPKVTARYAHVVQMAENSATNKIAPQF